MKLTTKYERYQMGTSAIAVPTRFSRFELSKLVNEALELEKPIPFDFIIDGVLLRVSLSEYISSHGLSLESTLVLEYVPIIGKPEEKSSEDLPDWIGGLSCIKNYYVAGCYDGSVHIYNSEDSLLASAIAHKKPIKSDRHVCWSRQPRSLLQIPSRVSSPGQRCLERQHLSLEYFQGFHGFPDW